MKFSRRKFIEGLGSVCLLTLIVPGALSERISSPLRPPGALSEEAFNTSCIRCFKCGQVCPTEAISFAAWQEGQLADTPILADLRSHPCNLCMECTKVCPTGALKKTEPEPWSIKENVKIGVAQIYQDDCIVYNGQRRRCHICIRVCPFGREAIYIDEMGRPVINEEICVGCGLCEKACPVEPTAISVRGVSSES